MEKKVYDLEERTYQFAKEVTLFSKTLKKTISTFEFVKQVVRSSASVGANYIEANEALSKKDFLLRVKIARKEAKETIYWLRLISETEDLKEDKIQKLIKECIELKKILSAIIEKSEKTTAIV